MIAPTHLITGQTAYFLAALATGHPATLTEAALAAVAGLLPDLDEPKSLIGRALPFISHPIRYHFGHRTATHSVIVIAAIALLLFGLLPHGYALALTAGIASHPLADMLTLSGVKLFWPSPYSAVLPGNSRYRFETNTLAELGFTTLMAVLSLLIAPLATQGLGTTELIRHAIGDIAAARQSYNAQKGENEWFILTESRNNHTQDDSSGRYRIIGEWQAAGFLIDTEEGAATLCNSVDCDHYAAHATLERGQPIQIQSYLLTGPLHTTELKAALQPFEVTEADLYLSGSATTTAPMTGTATPTLQSSGDQWSLTYAHPDSLPPAHFTAAHLTLQIRAQNGVVLPEFHYTHSATQNLPAELEKWL